MAVGEAILYSWRTNGRAGSSAGRLAGWLAGCGVGFASGRVAAPVEGDPGRHLIPPSDRSFVVPKGGGAMMFEASVREAIRGQFEAALKMFELCVRACPSAQWDEPIAKYPFWQVAYHTISFADLYLSPDEEAFELRDDLHPAGWDEFNLEYPSRRFDQDEILGYIGLVRDTLRERIESETAESLEGGSGQSHLPFRRIELYLYTFRHIQHHTGQLSALLRRAGVETGWVKSG
ncbi:MAG: DinB family protein [Phycisphaerales bacterium]